MIAPIKNNPTALNDVLIITAFIPPKKKNGATGIIAPTPHLPQEVIAPPTT